MIDYEERLDDLYRHLKEQYLIDDKEAVDIILATKLRPENGPWLVVETDYYDINDTDALWYGCEECRSTWDYKHPRPREGNRLLDKVFKQERRGRIWVEAEYQWPHRAHVNFDTWAVFEQSVVRLRTPCKKAVPYKDKAELDRLVSRVLDERWRTALEPTRCYSVIDWYYPELLTKLAERLRSWPQLVDNLTGIYQRVTWLRNKPTPGEYEKQLLSRVLKDTVPLWTTELVERMSEVNPTFSQLARTTYLTERFAKREAFRLKEQGITYHYHTGKHPYWALRKEVKEDVLKLVRGEVKL